MNKLPYERERAILVREEFETDERYGKRPDKRTVKENLDFGILNLNKQQGPTSHQVSDYVKKILEVNRAGHSGTLDPNVTGVLPIALNRGTRVLKMLLKAGKEYVCLMHLHDDVSEDKIRKTAEKLIGEIIQKPPVRSAVKRVERTRRIYYLEILEIDEKDVLFKVGCEAGTYVRTICTRIGKDLGIGAHMVQLVRTKVAMFNDNNWISLHDLKDAYEFYKDGDDKEIKEIIYPIEKAVEYLPKIWVFDSAVDSLCHGADLNLPGVSKFNEMDKNELVAIMTLKDELICVGESLMDSREMLKKKKGTVIKDKKVFMERGIYPRRD